MIQILYLMLRKCKNIGDYYNLANWMRNAKLIQNIKVHNHAIIILNQNTKFETPIFHR